MHRPSAEPQVVRFYDSSLQASCRWDMACYRVGDRLRGLLEKHGYVQASRKQR